MKRRLYIVFLLTLMMAISACGKSVDDNTREHKRDEAEELNESAEEDSKNVAKSEKNDLTLDANHFEAYNVEFKNSVNYDPVFENRCMYIDGNKVYLPTTVREFENLFGTKFTKLDKTTMGGWAYTNDNGQMLKVLMPYNVREALAGDDVLEQSKDVAFCGFIYGEASTRNGEDIWCGLDVQFEEVGRETVNEYGYYTTASPYEGAVCYRYYPACYQAYYEYIAGTIPQSAFDNESGYSMQDILEYSGGDANVEISFGDITCDVLDEMIIKTNWDGNQNEFKEAKIFTYDVKDKKLREIEYIVCDVCDVAGRSDYIDALSGMLVYITGINNSTEESEYRNYRIFNRYGASWKYVELKQIFDKTSYEWTYTINGSEVSKETYLEKKKMYEVSTTYFVGMKEAYNLLSTTASLTAQAFYTGDSNLSTVRLINAIGNIDLNSIGYNPDEQGDYNIDADYMDDSDLYEGEYTIDGAGFPGDEAALNAYREFLRGERKGSKGESINDYLSEPYDSIYFYYMKNPSSNGYALVINYANASTFNDIYYYENGEVVYKAYFGRHAMGASYLYNNEFIIWDSSAACGCSVSEVERLDSNYNPIEVVKLFEERSENCNEPSHEYGIEGYENADNYNVNSGAEYVNKILGVYGEELYDIPSNAVRIR